jgi:polyisoprenoid-binding protein YceI
MRMIALAPLLLLAACSLTGTQTQQALQSLPSGAYQLEKPHASLLFRVKHMGLSSYTARFTDFDATLDFDPKNPAASHVKAIINPLSVRAEHPTDKDWDRRIGEDLMEGKEYPQIVFDSKKIDVTGEYTGKVTGDLTFLGVTEPVTLDVTFNGAANGAALYQGRDAVGFSAHGKLARSDFGLTRYGSIVADEVEIILEVEFTRRG